MVLGSGLAMAAAAAMIGPGILERPVPIDPRYPKVKRKIRRRQADRSKKQYLLKGVRP
jgi:hypothetical protein